MANNVVVRKELKKFITFVNEFKTRVHQRLNYLEKNGMNKKKLTDVIKENRDLIKSLQAENSFLRSFLFKEFPDLKDKYNKFRNDYRGAITLLDLGKSDGKLKL